MDVRDKRPANGSGHTNRTALFDPTITVGLSRLLKLAKFLLPILIATWAYEFFSSPRQQGQNSHFSSTTVPIADIDVSKVLRVNLELARHSWEYGTLTHALLELQNPEFTVFAGPGVGFHLQLLPGIKAVDPFPNGLLPKANGHRYDAWTRVKGLRFASALIWTNASWTMTQMGTLVKGDGSVPDAASLGWACLLLEAAGAQDPRVPIDGQIGPDGRYRNVFAEAADRQVRCLMDTTGQCNIWFEVDSHNSVLPEDESRVVHADQAMYQQTGAISHRNDSQQLWADSVFMAPPFLAAYAIARQDLKWLVVALEQTLIYQSELVTDIKFSRSGDKCSGLWKHIVTQPRRLKDGVCCHDEHAWLTSNAWALAGMTRVLALITKWQPRDTVKGLSELGGSYQPFQTRARTQLLDLINPMLECLHEQDRDSETGLLKNYLDGPGSASMAWAFGDAAGTAMVTSVLYRLAVLEPKTYATSQYLNWADDLYNAVAQRIGTDGVVSPVADIANVPSRHSTPKTSEAQSMVLLMWSARRDCAKMGICRENPKSLWSSIWSLG